MLFMTAKEGPPNVGSSIHTVQYFDENENMVIRSDGSKMSMLSKFCKYQYHKNWYLNVKIDNKARSFEKRCIDSQKTLPSTSAHAA